MNDSCPVCGAPGCGAIRAALDDARGNAAEAARQLGVPYTTLVGWLDRYEIDGESARSYRARLCHGAGRTRSQAWTPHGAAVRPVDWVGATHTDGSAVWTEHRLRLLVAGHQITARLYLPAGSEPTPEQRAALRAALA